MISRSDENTTEWRYDTASGRYQRWVDTTPPAKLAPHTDAVNGQQLSAANVVVLYANHVTSVDPEDFGNGGHCGYEIQLWNSGPAKLFRDGQEYDPPGCASTRPTRSAWWDRTTSLR